MGNSYQKVAFRSLGCKVNEYEIEYMQQKMEQNGYVVVPFAQNADIYVINTCTVTNIADRKSRQMIHHAKKRNPQSIVVAVGCYVQTCGKQALEDEAVDIVIGNNNKSRIVEIIEQYIKDKNSLRYEDCVSDLTTPVSYEKMHIVKTAEHKRAFVKIQDGCNQFCSYCAIPLARGRIRSRSLEDIVSEVSDLSKNGYTEVVLTGIHLSSYGIDFISGEGQRNISYNDVAKTKAFTNRDLAQVILTVDAIEGIERIRLGSLEPRLITEEFLTMISKSKKLCAHFHLSLQSGSDETLRRMNRKYSVSEFEQSFGLLRKYFDNPAVTTDVIVGFPGESEDEFSDTYAFVRKIGFFELHVFKYSPRKNTVAAKMEGQIDDEVKSRRSDMLLEIDKKLSDDFKRSYLGREVEVLFEEKKGNFYVGHTKEYIMVGMKSEENLEGKIVKTVLDGDTLFFV